MQRCSQARIVGGHGGKPEVSHPLPVPKEAFGIARACKGIAIEDCPDVARGGIGKGVVGEETDGTGVVVKEF